MSKLVLLLFAFASCFCVDSAFAQSYSKLPKSLRNEVEHLNTLIDKTVPTAKVQESNHLLIFITPRISERRVLESK